MRIPDSVIEEVSRRTDIVELIGSYVSLKPSGSRYMGLCPFHNEKTASFSVNPEVGAYYCFGCHKGGSVFNFVMEIEGLNFPESVKVLAEKAGVQFNTEEEDDSFRHRKALLELYSRVANSFAYFLSDSERGNSALETLSERGIDSDTIRRFALGYAPDDPFWLRGFLEKKEYSAGFLSASGLFTRANEKRALFAGRIMFPIRNNRGEVVAFGGRITGGDGPKYINSPETEIFRKRSILYGIDLAQKSIRTSRRAVLSEGYMDVLAFHQAGAENAVAPLGTALTDEQGSFLQRHCDAALLVFDADEAGARATSRAAGILESHGIRCEVACLKEGTDPADLLRDGGSQAVIDAISSPLSALEFLVRFSMNANSAASPEGKEFVLNQVFPYISVMRSEVKRRESLRLAADLVGADREAVLRDYGRYHRLAKARSDGRVTRISSGHPGSAEDKRRELKPSDRATNQTTSHDLFLMLATVASRAHFSYVRRWIQPEDLEDPMAREIYVALEEAFRRDESSLELLLERIADPVAGDLIRRRLGTGEFDGKHDQAIHDGVLSIRRRALQLKVRDVEAMLRRAASGVGEPLDEAELLGEKMYLDRELQKLKGESG